MTLFAILAGIGITGSAVLAWLDKRDRDRDAHQTQAVNLANSGRES